MKINCIDKAYNMCSNIASTTELEILELLELLYFEICFVAVFINLSNGELASNPYYKTFLYEADQYHIICQLLTFLHM